MNFKEFKKKFPEGTKVTCKLEGVEITDAIIAYDSIADSSFANILQNTIKGEEFTGKSYPYKYSYAILSSDIDKDLQEFNIKINKPTMKKEKKVNNKSYKTTVEVEKTIKYTLPKYELNKGIHLYFVNDAGCEVQRITISPFIAEWSFEHDENVYRYINRYGGVDVVRESYINKNLIK